MLFPITAHSAVKGEGIRTCHLHATDDIYRLRLRAVACVLYVDNRHCEVDVDSQLAEISVAEHFEVRGHEILQGE